MRVADLVAPYPTVGLDARVVDAARLLAEEKVPGLIVLDDRGRPVTVLAGTQLLRMAVPACCQDDPTLARMIDEAAAHLVLHWLGGLTVAECLPAPRANCPQWTRPAACWRWPR